MAEMHVLQNINNYQARLLNFLETYICIYLNILAIAEPQPIQKSMQSIDKQRLIRRSQK
jgi:hypothetical protein